jgi:hypothetical protein
MFKSLAASRKHKTSFTALLHTLNQVALASEVYPYAKLGFSRQAVNIRPLLKVNTGLDHFNDTANQYDCLQWLPKYRKAGSSSSSDISQTLIIPCQAPPHPVTRSFHKADMNAAIHKTGQVIQYFLMGKLLGEDIEEIDFYGLGMYRITLS